MIKSYLPFIFAVIIGITYYITNRLDIKQKKYYHIIISFAAGVSITYILLELFPNFTEVALSISKLLFLSILLGFIIHHIIEKEIYKHSRDHELIKFLSLEENVFSFVYHVILGIILVVFVKESMLEGILAFIPILTFTLVSTLPMKPHNSKWQTAFMSGSTLFGVLIATLWEGMPLWLEFSLVGLATGVLLYTVIRHHIPFGNKGRIGYFTLGFIIYAFLITISWYI